MFKALDVFRSSSGANDLSSNITKAIRKSQHCQRNWDLTKKMDSNHLNALKVAVSECPSKQNLSFYSVYFITNRDIIEKIHSATNGFALSSETNETITNSQTLANLLIAFVKNDKIISPETWGSNPAQQLENFKIVEKEFLSNSEENENLIKDRMIAVGVAAGYANLTANLLGYSTGCCSCFDGRKVAETLKIESEVLLLMGIGFKDECRSRLEHHKNSEILFPTLKKQSIQIIDVP